MRQATELLTTGQTLVVFPEGEIYHTNERLTPLREGVAFMAVTAQKDLEKEQKGRQVWVVPAAINRPISASTERQWQSTSHRKR